MAAAASAERELLELLAVEREPETRPGRHGDLAVLRLRQRLFEDLRQGVLDPHPLETAQVVDGRREVQRRELGDATREPGVRRDLDVVRLRERAKAHRRGEAPDARD